MWILRREFVEKVDIEITRDNQSFLVFCKTVLE